VIVLVLLVACVHYACLKELLRGDQRGVSHGVCIARDEEWLGRLIEVLPTVSVCPSVRIFRGQVRAERGRGSTVFAQRPIPWPRSWLRLIVGGGVVRVGVVLLVVRGVVRTGGGVRWCW